MPEYTVPQVVIIGGGPAGLMAAEVLSLEGVQVDVYDTFARPEIFAGWYRWVEYYTRRSLRHLLLPLW